MTTYEGARASARRSRAASAGVAERIRAGAEQRAQMVRQDRAVQEQMATQAQTRMQSARLETARVTSQSIMASGQARARAQAAMGDLMNNLGATFVATANKVMEANADANVAEEKVRHQRQAREAVAAASMGQPLPADVYATAAKDAYSERAATLQARRDAVGLDERLANTNDPNAVFNVVDQTMASKAEGMEDSAYREYYLNSLRTLGDKAAVERQASLINDRNQRQVREAVAAASMGKSLPPDIHLTAAKDAFSERAAILQAHRDAVGLVERLADTNDPNAVFDVVHETMAINAEGMEDPAYREYYLNSLRTLGDRAAAERQASLINEARAEQFNTSISSLVVEVMSGSVTTAQDLDAKIDAARLAVPTGFQKDFHKEAAAALLKDAASRGTLHKIVPLLSQTKVLERYPVLLQNSSKAIYEENKARHKKAVDAQVDEIQGIVGNVLNDKGATLEDISVAQSAIGRFLQIGGRGTVESANELQRRIVEWMPKLHEKLALARRYQNWNTTGGAFDEAFRPFVNKEITAALESQNWSRVERLMTNTGHIPQLLVENINGVFKGRDGAIDPEAALKHAPMIQSVLNADQMSNGQLLNGLDDPQAGLLLREVRRRADEGFGVNVALSGVLNNYTPDVLTRMADFNVTKALGTDEYDIVLSRKIGERLRSTEVLKTVGSWIGLTEAPMGFDGVDPGMVERLVVDEVRFRSKGIDDGKLLTYAEEAIDTVLERLTKASVPLPTVDGTKVTYVPNRSMRNDLLAGQRFPNGEQFTAAQVIEQNMTTLSGLMTDPMFAKMMPEDSSFDAENFALTTGFFPSTDRNGKQVLKARVGMKDTPPFDHYGVVFGDPKAAEAVNDRLESMGSALRFEPDPSTGDHILTYTWDRQAMAADGENALKWQQEVDRISKEIGRDFGEKTVRRFRHVVEREGPNGMDPEEIRKELPVVGPKRPYSGTSGRPWATNEEIQKALEQEAKQDSLYNMMRALQEDGVISKNWGTTRALPRVESDEDINRVITEALDDYQMNENGGLPVDKMTTPYNESYLAKRREVIEAHEGYRPEIYEDHKGITTVGVGINLEDPTVPEFFRRVGWDYEAYRSGRKQFTKQMLDVLYDWKISEAEKFVSSKIKVPLSQNQRISLVSLAFNNPSLIGPNLTRFVNEGDWENAEEEIRRRSNKNKHKGIQNRRNLEADLFSMDTHEAKPHFHFT